MKTMKFWWIEFLIIFANLASKNGLWDVISLKMSKRWNLILWGRGLWDISGIKWEKMWFCWCFSFIKFVHVHVCDFHSDFYDHVKTVGEGSMGAIAIIRHKTSKKEYAVKKIILSRITEDMFYFLKILFIPI